MRTISLKSLAWLLALICCAWACAQWGSEEPEQAQPSTYVGSEACGSCHADAYAQWRESDHFKAMLPAHDSTVLGDFSGATLSEDGITTTFHRNDTAFFMTIQELDGTQTTYPIRYTFGHYPLQQYLVEFPQGRMQATRASWDSRNQRWFHQYGGTRIAQDDWLHWTRGGQNWNTMCASCHSTNLQKNYTEASDTYHTTWSEINVACEACHGPGSAHVAFYEQPEKQQKPTLAYGKTLENSLEVQMCAPCHARKADLGPGTGAHFMDHHIAQIPTDDFYHPDGQVREEDYVYGSFVQSKMYHRGVACTNCHNPHTGKRLLEGNALCLTCHEPSYATPTHHFHPENSLGAQCIECHMPVATFMGNDHRRDHSFRIPRPDQSVVYGTPNACTGCHAEKSDAWAARAVSTWYGPTRTYHFSDDLLPGSGRTAQGVPALARLLADTAQPALARAAAAAYLGDGAWPTGLNPLLTALHDATPEVRYQALRALARYAPDQWQVAAAPLLLDSVRAVRIAAANLYHQAGIAPPAGSAGYAEAAGENRDYLFYQTDFPVGNLLRADYHAQGGAYEQAVAYYRRGLEKDNRMEYARQNLATLLSALGQNGEARKVLEEGLRLAPDQTQLRYSLALLLAEEGEMEQAERTLARVISAPDAPVGAFSNFAVLLMQQQRQPEAIRVLEQSLRTHASDPQLHYLMALCHLQLQQPQKAAPWVQKLHDLDPENAEYAALYRQFNPR